MPSAWYDFPIEQGYHWSRNNTHAHSGVDLAAPEGTPITAPESGPILTAGYQKWGGQVSEGINYGGQNANISWLHMRVVNPLTQGQWVPAGTPLGESGTPPPGYGKGPHIHFELTHGGVAPYTGYNPWTPTQDSYPMDPLPFVNNLRSTGGGNPNGDPTGGSGGLSNAFGNAAGWGAAFGAFWPFGNPADIPSAIQGATVSAEAAATDALKRTGLFLLGVLVIVVGVLILVWPQVAQRTRKAAGLAKAGFVL